MPVLLLLSILAFSLDALGPSDQARVLLEATGNNEPPAEAVAAKRAELGLDLPAPLRYLNWLSRAVQGDFGLSYRSYRPVADLYLAALPNTLLLAGIAITAGALIAIPVGLCAGYRRGSVVDVLAQLLAVLGSAVPGFWLALIGILFFAVTLRWLPAFGSPTPLGVILPAAVLTLQNLSVITRLTRSVTIETLGLESITLARAKGLRERSVALGHVLPNVLPPVVTQLGVELAGLLVGAAVIEYVFAWPGIGKLAVDAALLRDTPVVVGFALAAGVMFIVVNLVADLIVAAIDPRVRSV